MLSIVGELQEPSAYAGRSKQVMDPRSYQVPSGGTHMPYDWEPPSMTTLVAQSAYAAADTGVRFSRGIVSSNILFAGRAEMRVSVVSKNVLR